jgi:cytochrome P450
MGEARAMTVWTPTDDGFADLASHDAFATGAPHATFARLRREAPLHWQDWDGGAGFWNVTRHADVEALNRDPGLMSSARGIRMEDQTYEEYLARRTFQETDPPEHTRVRRKVNRAFAKPVVAVRGRHPPALPRHPDRALRAGRVRRHEGDRPPVADADAGRILGTPDEDLEWLVAKGDALIANTDPDFTDHVLDRLDTDAYRMMPFNSPAGAELYDYARDLMARKAAAGDTTGCCT